MARVATLGELATSLAHELNQPLTAIVSNAQAGGRFLAQEAPDTAEVRAVLSDIADDGKRAGEVIRRLRTLQKKSGFERKPLDMNEVIREVVALLQNDVILKNITLRTELATGLPPASGDPIQLEQVILNLLRNGSDAMKASPEGARRLEVRTSVNGTRELVVDVKDSGPPLPEEALAKIFTPFYTTKPDGLGMGLAISRSIVEAHGGRIWAERNPDRGITVRLTLPTLERG